MNRKVLYVSLALTAIATAGAATSIVLAPGDAMRLGVEAPAFPKLRAAPESVARIELDTGKEQFALVRGPDGWTAPGRSGYAASRQKVRELLAQLSDMRVVEAKTARPDLFQRVGVDGPEKVREAGRTGEESKRVKLLAEDGTVLVDAILGLRMWRQTGGKRSGTFIRREGEGQAWLVSGGLFISDTEVNWLESEIANVPDDHITRIQVTPAEGEAYVALRAADGKTLTIEGDERPLDESAVNRLAGGFSRLEFEDVKPAAEMPLPEPRSKAVYTTNDGLTLTIEVAAVGDDRWGTVTVDVAADAKDEAKQTAERITRRAKGWTFKLPNWTYDRLTMAKEAMFKKEKTS